MLTLVIVVRPVSSGQGQSKETREETMAEDRQEVMMALT